MATFLDITILSHFTSVFTFLLVFVVVFGLLEAFKIFGDDKKGLHAIVALALGFMVVISNGVTTVVQTFAPWMMVLMLVLFFILFLVRMFGMNEKDIKDGFHKNTAITTWIIILTAVVLLYSLASAFGQESLEKGPGTKINVTTATVINDTSSVSGTSATNTNDFMQNMYNTLYHPKILGLILVMLVGVLAMLFLTIKETEPT